MKILLTDAGGMLGRTLARRLAEHEILAADFPEWDVADDDGFLARTLDASPDVVIHCAAMTDLDECETERDRAFLRNEDGARNVALAAKAAGARLFAVSTGFVFSGEPPREPWAWSETDLPRPRTVFGMSMFAGEQMVSMLHPDSVVVRTEWLYGAGGPSFVHELAAAGATDGEPLRVADGLRGNPTSAETVADVVAFLLARPHVAGIVHATCEDQCSPYEWALELKRLLGGRFPRALAPGDALKPCRGATPQPRCAALKKSVLNVLGYRTPTWQKALVDFVKEEFE